MSTGSILFLKQRQRVEKEQKEPLFVRSLLEEGSSEKQMQAGELEDK